MLGVASRSTHTMTSVGSDGLGREHGTVEHEMRRDGAAALSFALIGSPSVALTTTTPDGAGRPLPHLRRGRKARPAVAAQPGPLDLGDQRLGADGRAPKCATCASNVTIRVPGNTWAVRSVMAGGLRRLRSADGTSGLACQEAPRAESPVTVPPPG